MPSVYPEPGWVVTARTVSDKDVATEPTWMSSWRVLAIITHPGSPLIAQWDSSASETFLLTRSAEVSDDAFSTIRAAGLAGVTAMQNQPMVCIK